MKTIKTRILPLLLTLALTVVLALPAGAVGLTAIPKLLAVYVDGRLVTFDTYNIGGYNYFKLRDVAYSLSATGCPFEAVYDADNDVVLLTSEKTYTVIGGEMQSKGNEIRTPMPTRQKIYLDGEEISLNAYNIGGNNYFKIRDLGHAIGFEVQYNPDDSSVRISGDLPYTGADYISLNVSSDGVTEGVIGGKYGALGARNDNGMPTLSLPLSVSGAPEGTVSYAVFIRDPDALPMFEIIWVHWLAANFTAPDIPENASITLANDIVQGINSFGAEVYGGPAPPDKAHTYVTTVYALDIVLDMDEGFGMDDLAAAMTGHILAQGDLLAEYPSGEYW